MYKIETSDVIMDSNDELGQAVLSQDNGEASNLKEHTRSLLENILEIDEESLMTDLRIQCDDGIVQTYRFNKLYLYNWIYLHWMEH